jgi:antitoxin (DNA-binding transcriptional repressor) of toxin-antitoxin stability system
MTMTIRDLRQRWPVAEKALQTEGEVTITRDGRAVAKLVPVEERQERRRRFDPKKHIAEMLKLQGGKFYPSRDEEFAASREDRKL